ncbi:MAG: potassium-transporting ATPase subunit KdpC [Verrucomicrobiales bacterium]|nr:potassium-transporting ATPase subunit KdpC [Verrucomicrobiales bacterium]
MNPLLQELRASLMATLCLLLTCTGLYPLLVWGFAQQVLPELANGSVLRDPQGQLLGSRLIGRNFQHPRYFLGRPSAAGAAGYDATASGGANLGPTSRALQETLARRIQSYRKLNDVPAPIPIPADAVTASGSGLDPHISVANARLQLPRVARERGCSPEVVLALLERHTTPPAWRGLLGPAHVNVLELNLALDDAQAGPTATPPP